MANAAGRPRAPLAWGRDRWAGGELRQRTRWPVRQGSRTRRDAAGMIAGEIPGEGGGVAANGSLSEPDRGAAVRRTWGCWTGRTRGRCRSMARRDLRPLA
ncbi:hypothetical protein Lesp02_40980 [Lentzea sp. NBRC 105346]|nr:hypothetical protein Lesp02_40980 [Lentzea sp. NBRC 105346]